MISVEQPRNTISRGELVKLNLYECDCGMVYVPEMQATRVNNLKAGWYEKVQLGEIFHSAFNQQKAIDVVPRYRRSGKNNRKCPDCKK